MNAIVQQDNVIVLQDVEMKAQNLASNVIETTRAYIASQSGTKTADFNLYNLMLEVIEKPMLRTVMEMMRYNQSKAAKALGISRGTLRTKLKEYFDDEFIGTRDDN